MFITYTPTLKACTPHLEFRCICSRAPSAYLLRIVIYNSRDSKGSFTECIRRVVVRGLVSESDRREEARRGCGRVGEEGKGGSKRLPPRPGASVMGLPPDMDVAVLVGHTSTPMIGCNTPEALFVFTSRLSAVARSGGQTFSSLGRVVGATCSLNSACNRSCLDRASCDAIISILLGYLFYKAPTTVSHCVSGGTVRNNGVAHAVLYRLRDRVNSRPPALGIVAPTRRRMVSRAVRRLVTTACRSRAAVRPRMVLSAR